MTEPAQDVVEQVELLSVDIYDQIYHLRGGDAGYIERLSQMVDAKMRAVAAQGTVDSLRVAVLASLNLADELEVLRSRYRELSGSLTRSTRTVRNRSASLAHMLDEVFDEVDTEPVRRAG